MIPDIFGNMAGSTAVYISRNFRIPRNMVIPYHIFRNFTPPSNRFDDFYEDLLAAPHTQQHQQGQRDTGRRGDPCQASSRSLSCRRQEELSSGELESIGTAQREIGPRDRTVRVLCPRVALTCWTQLGRFWVIQTY